MSARNGQSHSYDERHHVPKVRLTPIESMAHGGAIKWFDSDRKYGFVTLDSGLDAILHISTARLYSLRDEHLIKSVRVRCDIRAVPGRCAEVTAIAIA